MLCLFFLDDLAKYLDRLLTGSFSLNIDSWQVSLFYLMLFQQHLIELLENRTQTLQFVEQTENNDTSNRWYHLS